MKILKNKKVVLASAIILGISAITSSALAAYIITGGTVAQDKTIDPTEISVDNQVVNLTVGNQVGELKFYPASVVESGRVTSDEAGNLTVSYELTMTADSEGKIPNITVTVAEAESGTLVSGGYVTVPEAQTITDTWNGSSGTFTKTLTLTWDWGDTFGNVEPTTYFNKGGKGATTPDSEVIKTLEKFRDAVAASSFTVKITEAAA